MATGRPERYGKQLVAHLGRRNGGEWSETGRRGWIKFGAGRAELAATPEGLRLSIETEPENLAQLEDVVGRHLIRFATHDELHVRWSRETGEAGTEQ